MSSKRQAHLAACRQGVLAALCILLTSSCSGSQSRPVVGPPIPVGVAPMLSWTASFARGVQQGPISFPSIGETAVVMIAPDPQEGSTSQVSSGPCVTLSSSLAATSVTVTAAVVGSCTINVNWVGFSAQTQLAVTVL